MGDVYTWSWCSCFSSADWRNLQRQAEGCVAAGGLGSDPKEHSCFGGFIALLRPFGIWNPLETHHFCSDKLWNLLKKTASSSIFAHKWHERNDKPGNVQLGCPGFGGCGFTTGWKILVYFGCPPNIKPRMNRLIKDPHANQGETKAFEGCWHIGLKNHSASFSCVSSHGKRTKMQRVYLYFAVLVWSKFCALFDWCFCTCRFSQSASSEESCHSGRNAQGRTLLRPVLCFYLPLLISEADALGSDRGGSGVHWGQPLGRVSHGSDGWPTQVWCFVRQQDWPTGRLADWPTVAPVTSPFWVSCSRVSCGDCHHWRLLEIIGYHS